ncbi:hypothetical protein Ndes2526B_g00494 [Nannochloris sp. 'desiccata']|nr:hypothetical protein KSW81_003812 [Chlorella desiccata (nom. nud.)]KAH7624310.1 hypothetical protein NADE_003663 [Chlorella desiccata (nom. nud.)]
MLSNFRNKLQGGQPRSLVVVRPATVGGFFSGAINLAWLIISSLGTEIIYILALLVGVVVGLSQGIFNVSVHVVKSPFTSPSKKTIGGDDDRDSVGEKPSSSSEKLPLELKEVDDLRPRHLFVEAYGGVVDEQRGTEMHTPDDFVGPGTVESLLVPVQKQPEISPGIQETAPISAATEKESEQIFEATEPIAVLLPSPAVDKNSEELQAITHPKHTKAPVDAEDNSSPQSIAPAPLVENTELTSAATQGAAEAMTPQPVPTLVQPQLSSPEAISPVDRLTAAELEDNALLATSSRRSDVPSPPTDREKVDILEHRSFDAPETPKMEPKSTVPLPAFEDPAHKLEDVPVPAPLSTATATEAALAPSIQQDTEPAIAALPTAKPTPVDKPAVTSVTQEEQKGTLKKKKNRGPIRGPLHKAAKEIRKAFR